MVDRIYHTLRGSSARQVREFVEDYTETFGYSKFLRPKAAERLDAKAEVCLLYDL